MEYLKIKVYINRPRDLDGLRENTIQEIRNLTHDSLIKVMETDVQGMCFCLSNSGGHLKDFMYIAIQTTRHPSSAIYQIFFIFFVFYVINFLTCEVTFGAPVYTCA